MSGVLTRAHQLNITEGAELPLALVANSHRAIEDNFLVSEILKALSTIEKDVLLRFTYGMKHPQIAAELKISVGMSRQHLSRARKRLTDLLGGSK